MPKTKWVKINDRDVRHVWKCQCGCDTKKIAISPDFYEENGTPICNSGVDMIYVRTEISVPRRKP